jgi:hypothetical protein
LVKVRPPVALTQVSAVLLQENRNAHSPEVDLAKWFEPAAASIGKPRPEQVGKLIPVNRVADGGRVTKSLAATQVSS